MKKGVDRWTTGRCPPCPKRTLAGRKTLRKISLCSDFHYQARSRNFAVGDVVIDVFAGQMLAGLNMN